jgi:hypothetical protein
MIFWGTAITYLVISCYFAMMSIMFTKHSRFADLQKKLEVVKRKIEVSYRFVLVMSMSSFAQTHNHDHDGVMLIM